MKKITEESAIKELRNNNVIAMPTETVYGLAGSISSSQAIEKIFKTKERPFFDPLIVHVSSFEMVEGIWKKVNPLLKSLAQSFWPGPLTLIAPKNENVSEMITASLDTVAIRMPKHPQALSLIRNLNSPVAAPSANRFSKTSPTAPEHVYSEFGDSVSIIDGGICSVGIESTVLEVRENENNSYELIIHRPGAILKSDIEKALGSNFLYKFIASSEVKSPGQMPFHYQPDIPLKIIEDNIKPEQGVELELPLDGTIAARVLYSRMREIAKKDVSQMYLIRSKYPKEGIWEAIWERLIKASTKG